jgi:hypothetical protein
MEPPIDAGPSIRTPSSQGGGVTTASGIIHLDPLCARYVWIEDLILPLPGQGVLAFEARATNDIHVCLHSERSRALSEGDSRFPSAAAQYEFVRSLDPFFHPISTQFSLSFSLFLTQCSPNAHPMLITLTVFVPSGRWVFCV